jgi:hypothetical protein
MKKIQAESENTIPDDPGCNESAPVQELPLAED